MPRSYYRSTNAAVNQNKMSPTEINPIEMFSEENNNYETQDTEFKGTNMNMFNDFKAVKQSTNNHWVNFRGQK